MKWSALVLGMLCAGLPSLGWAEDPPSPVTKQAGTVVTPKGPVTAQKPVTAPPKVMDRIDLEATEVTGGRELPKVMVIVPWKHADGGAVAGRPANSLMDEVLKPLDRDVLRREVDYYAKLGTTPSEPPSKPEN